MKKIISLFLLITLLSACAPVAPTSELPPEAIIATSIAATIASLPTSTLAPTNTPLPAPTEITVLPTATVTETPQPSVTPLPTMTPIIILTATSAFTPTATVTKETAIQTLDGYSCQLLSKKPLDGTIFKPGDKFDGKWILLNVGKKAWDSSAFDLFYVKGDKFHDFNDVVDLPKTYKEGEKLEFILDMTAPKKTGTYTTVWGIGTSKKVFCTFSVSIQVQKK